MIHFGKRLRYAAGAALLLATILGFHQASQGNSTAAAFDTSSVPAGEPYAPQKVVYHINEGGGWFGHDHLRRLQNMENHLDALPKGQLQLAVVLQGNGLDLLTDAAKDKALATKVAALRGRGVKFLICRNTLISKHIGVDKLDGAAASDIVGAGVAEVSRLQSLGYAYLKL